MSDQPIVLITGASSGIGFAISIEFAKRGYKVYGGARRVEPMEALKQYGIIPIHLDVSSIESIKKVSSKILNENNGKLDILYNNAGVSYRGSLFDLTPDQVEQSFKVNVQGPIFLIQAFSKALLKTKGTVIFTNSVIDFTPVPFSGAYSSSKSALTYISKTLFMETNKFGIKVINVYTGAVESGMTSQTTKTLETSIYYLKEDDVMKPLAGSKTSAIDYSRNVVNDIEKAIRNNQSYTEIFKGKGSTFAWIIGILFSFKTYSKLIMSILKMNEPLVKVQKNLELEL